VSERLPELLDAKKLQAQLGVTRAAAEAIIRRLPVVQIEGLRKTYVRRQDVAHYLEGGRSRRTRCRGDLRSTRGGPVGTPRQGSLLARPVYPSGV
jgi:hypothetical protein